MAPDCLSIFSLQADVASAAGHKFLGRGFKSRPTLNNLSSFISPHYFRRTLGTRKVSVCTKSGSRTQTIYHLHFLPVYCCNISSPVCPAFFQVIRAPIGADITHAFYFYDSMTSREIACHLFVIQLVRYRCHRRRARRGFVGVAGWQGARNLMANCLRGLGAIRYDTVERFYCYCRPCLVHLDAEIPGVIASGPISATDRTA